MTVLLGSTGAGTDGGDFEGAGVQIGSKYVASATGTVDTISIRTNTHSPSATTIQAAVFSDSAGTPGSKIGNTVTITAVSNTKAWYKSAPGAGAAVTSGTTYWLIFLSPTGGAEFDFSLFDATTSAGTKDDSTAGANIKSPWTAGGSFNELMDAYAEDSGAVAAPPTSPRRMPLGL